MTLKGVEQDRVWLIQLKRYYSNDAEGVEHKNESAAGNSITFSEYLGAADRR